MGNKSITIQLKILDTNAPRKHTSTVSRGKQVEIFLNKLQDGC